jgi:uncharacterized protein YdaT
MEEGRAIAIAISKAKEWADSGNHETTDITMARDPVIP